MFPAMPFERTRPPTGIEKYLGPEERVIHSTRRHPVVLGSAAVVWLIALALGLATGLSFPTQGSARLSLVGAAIIVAGTLFLGRAVWRWRVGR